MELRQISTISCNRPFGILTKRECFVWILKLNVARSIHRKAKLTILFTPLQMFGWYRDEWWEREVVCGESSIRCNSRWAKQALCSVWRDQHLLFAQAVCLRYLERRGSSWQVKTNPSVAYYEDVEFITKHIEVQILMCFCHFRSSITTESYVSLCIISPNQSFELIKKCFLIALGVCLITK